jgi:L,D-peptidoglycan transpeptidase YkuD (ErfK/YbiS/YcfS/YnhG family)
MARIVALSAYLVLFAAASASGGSRAASLCLPTLASELASTGSAQQLVTVVAPRSTSTRGTLQLWRKSGDCWFSAGGPWPAWLGERGVSEHKREGDRARQRRTATSP